MSYRQNKHTNNSMAKGLFKKPEAASNHPPAEPVRSVRHIPRLNMPPPGTSPGIEAHELSARASTDAPVRVTCVDYCPEQMQIEQVTDLNNFLDRHRPAWSRVRWIQVEGLSRMEAIRAFAEKYQLHPLAIEDMLIASNQPKLEDYPGSDEMPGRLFIVGRMVKMDGDALSSEQVSLFLGRSTLLSFQNSISPVFESIYHRIEIPGSRLRTHDVSFLLHALMDAIVDSYFPALESYGECLEELDDELRARPAPNTLQRIHEVKRNLVLLRRSIWPMRELVAHLQPVRDHTDLFPGHLRPLRTDHRFVGDLSRNCRSSHRNLHGRGVESHERNHEGSHGHFDHLYPADLPGRRLRDEHAASRR
jgi:magnesium transporter